MIKQLCINKHNTCLSRKLETGYLMTGNYSKTYFLHKHIIKASLCQGDYIHYPLSIIIHWIYNVLVPNHKQRHHSTRAKQTHFWKAKCSRPNISSQIKNLCKPNWCFFPVSNLMCLLHVNWNVFKRPTVLRKKIVHVSIIAYTFYAILFCKFGQYSIIKY